MLRMMMVVMMTNVWMGLCAWILIGAVETVTLGGGMDLTAMSPAVQNFFEVDKCDLCLGTSLCSNILSGDVFHRMPMQLLFGQKEGSEWARLGLKKRWIDVARKDLELSGLAEDWLQRCQKIEDWSPAEAGPDGHGGSRRPPAHRRRYRGRHRNEAEAWRVVEAARPLQWRQQHALDAALCSDRGSTAASVPTCSSPRHTPRFRRWMQAKRLTADLVEGLRAPLLACPSQRLLDRIVRRFAEASDGGSVFLHHLDEGERLRLLFTLAAAPHLILQQIFPMEEGWPFARYIGACGRLAVSVATVPLADFVAADPERSADLAYQVLTITAGMTSNDLGYLLYFTEMHGAVFGVRCDGRLRVADAGVIGVIDQQQEASVPMTLTAGHSDIFSALWGNTSQPLPSPPSHPPSVRCAATVPSSPKELEARNVALVSRLLLRPLLANAFPSPRGLQSQVDSLLALCDDLAVGPRVVTESAASLRSLLDSLRPCRPDFPYRYPECRYSAGHGPGTLW